MALACIYVHSLHDSEISLMNYALFADFLIALALHKLSSWHTARLNDIQAKSDERKQTDVAKKHAKKNSRKEHEDGTHNWSTSTQGASINVLICLIDAAMLLTQGHTRHHVSRPPKHTLLHIHPQPLLRNSPLNNFIKNL